MTSEVQPDKNDVLRIIVLGYIVRGPIGGLAWHHLQYVLGLSRMGHDVVFVEDSGDSEWACYDPSKGETGIDPDYGLQFAQQSFDRVGLGARWCYYDAFKTRWHGPFADKINAFCQSADLLINLSGANMLRGKLSSIPIRVYVDTDPAFTQIRNLQDEARHAFVAQHNVFFSFGENMATGECRIPDDGFTWQPTRQPVLLDIWPVTPGPDDGRFTTVMQWDSYKVCEHAGIHYGMKSHSFEPYMDFPGRTECKLEIALGSESAPREQLELNGWLLRDPLKVTLDLWSYQRYIMESKAEFSVAKQGYVLTNSGWFSERSANYLASGRPVLVQETGFSAWMDTGMGVIAFSNPDEAVTGLEEISASYLSHCGAARELARQYFDSSNVLGSLIERATQSVSSSID